MNWKNTRAISLAGSLYLNPQEEKYKQLKDVLKGKLKHVKYQNQYIIENILDGKQIYDVYKGSPLELYIKMKKGFYISRGFKINSDLFESNDNWKAHHSPTGILILNGPNVKRNVIIKGVRIVDLAPTILHRMGVSIPNQLDGKVLKEIF